MSFFVIQKRAKPNGFTLFMVGVKRLELPASSCNAACGAQNCQLVSLRTILTAAPSHTSFICHRQRSYSMPKAGMRLFVFRMPKIKSVHCKNKKEQNQMALLFLYGRSEETRTPGILLPKQARYQLRYTPSEQR